MNVALRERLFREIETLCKDTSLDFEGIRQELSEFIGSEKVIDYHISRGPLPDFADTVFDAMILGEKGLYDYERRQKAALLHFQPLSKLVEISEAFTDDDFLTVQFRIGELGGGLVMQGPLGETGKLRRFSNAVRKKIIEST